MTEAATQPITDPTEPEVREVRVIWNASAGGKVPLASRPTTAAEVADLLARHGIAADVRTAESSEDATSQARRAAADRCAVVVAAGGDGTIGSVARGLLHTDVALGVLPLGSVMNIARMLGLPRDLEEAAHVLATGRVRAMDVGETRGEIFFETASVGINAHMFREASRFEEGDYGSVLRTIWVALRYRPARMKLDLDDRTLHSRALMVTVGNGPYMGVGMTVAPQARLDDGHFDVRVFRNFSKFELLRHLGAIAFGRRSYTPHAMTYRSRYVRIDGARPLPCRADSVDLGYTPLECRVIPAALRVVVPADTDGAVDSGGAGSGAASGSAI